MGCCGDRIKKIITIGRNYVKAGLEGIDIIKPYKHRSERIIVCRQCEESTWMTMKEYIDWLGTNGIEILKNIDQLEKLDKLPKYPLSEKRRNLFCRICKCYVPCKAGDNKQECPLNKTGWRFSD